MAPAADSCAILAQHVHAARVWGTGCRASAGRHGHACVVRMQSGAPFSLCAKGGRVESHGPHTFGGELQRPMTAHPKRDPDTGALHFFSMMCASQLPFCSQSECTWSISTWYSTVVAEVLFVCSAGHGHDIRWQTSGSLAPATSRHVPM